MHTGKTKGILLLGILTFGDESFSSSGEEKNFSGALTFMGKCGTIISGHFVRLDVMVNASNFLCGKVTMMKKALFVVEVLVTVGSIILGVNKLYHMISGYQTRREGNE